jgi:hypothetical protein
MQPDTKILQPTAGVRALFVILYVIGTFLMSVRFGKIAVAVYLVCGAFTLALVFRRRIVLSADGLSMVSDFRVRTIPRSEIENVTWEKGAGAHLKLRDGKCVRLPEVGLNAQALTNSIRAWLKRTESNSVNSE